MKSNPVIQVSRVSSFFSLFLFLFLFCQRAECWETLPEFQGLTETEQAGSFEGPRLLVAEYTSDVLTYLKPPDWEYLWLSHTKVLEVSFGSINTRRFLMDNRLKIHQKISDLFEIRFTYFDESNLERQSMHHILELIFWPWPKLGLVVYGEPSFRKPTDDTGLALLFRPNDQHEIRLFNTYLDVTRLKYPDTSDSFIEPDLPTARGLVGRVWGQPPKDEAVLGDFLEYSIRHETFARWQFFDANYEYRYWKFFTSLYGRHQFSKYNSTALRLQFDRKFESRTATGPTTEELGAWYTNRLSVLGEHTFYLLGPGKDWDLTLGTSYIMRRWDTDQGLGKYDDILPYVRWKLPAWGPTDRKDHWILGYVFTWHLENGPQEIGIRPEDNRQVQQRINLSYEFNLNNKGRILLLASADLDEIGTRRSWAGGLGQLQLFF